MRNRINHIIVRVRRFLNPTFFVFVVISGVLLYLSKLTHDYVTTIQIPIEIQNSINKNIGVVGGKINVECRVDGQGYELLVRKLFPRVVSVDISKLNITPLNESYYSEISHQSLIEALSQRIGTIKILSIVTPHVEIVASPLRTKRVPVISNISVECRSQYMQIGRTRIEPDSVTVKSPDAILDTLRGIHTAGLRLRDVSRNMAGTVELRPVDGVVMGVGEVNYQVSVEAYTELELTMPIEVMNAPEGYRTIVIPSEARVKFNVSRSSYSANATKDALLYVDAGEKASNIDEHLKVYVACGRGLYMKEMHPYYVKILFEPVDTVGHD